jgi:hypothetical protein
VSENTNASVQSQGAAAPHMSFVARMVGVIFSPGSTFEDIARAPDFIAPLLTIILVSVAATETLLRKVGMARIVQMSLDQSGQAQNMSPDQVQQAIQRGVTFGSIFARVGAVIGTPILLLIVAAVGLLILNAFFGAEAKFGKVFSAACYTGVTIIVGNLIALPIFLFGDPNAVNMADPIPTNVGFFLNPLETSKPLYVVASSVDIIRFWFIALLAIGLSRVAEGKVKTSWIFGCLFGIWLVILLIRVGLALI